MTDKIVIFKHNSTSILTTSTFAKRQHSNYVLASIKRPGRAVKLCNVHIPKRQQGAVLKLTQLIYEFRR